eukprot:TRINITY_DN41239_c0_g1_i1.p1 TRINITY_DN41239_c0_g1~~TRINITY_DN41239_c0_g1_i1.p1  ORF type:complete len:244 (-),score=44.89 TRINITY_DN41239_c0_g1_i1:124-786(-)
MGEEFLSGFFQGCLIALPTCFLVLLMSTMNLITSSYAVVAVSGVVTSVLGFCKSVMGYDLGVAEAIAGVIVIGYSVDYTVHLSHMYSEASNHGHSSRVSRAEFALCNMGSTIFAGAGTTMSAGAVMFLCYVTFFNKMAVLICATIFYSMFFALGFFAGMLFIAGPEGHCGDLWHLCFKVSNSVAANANIESTVVADATNEELKADGITVVGTGNMRIEAV